MKRNFNVLKKLGAVAVCFAMTAFCAAPAFAADASVAKGDPSGAAATGIYGKAESDKALEKSGTYRANYAVNTDKDYTQYKYLVIDINIAPVNEINSIYLQTTGSNLVTKAADKLKKSNGDYAEGQWNNLRFVCETPTTTYTAGRTTCYVNGKEVYKDSENRNFFTTTSGKTEIRIAIDSTVTETQSDGKSFSAYMDDVNIYLTDDVPQTPQMPALPDTYSVTGSVLKVNPNTKLSDITVDGATVRGYNSTDAIGSESALENGDKVVLETGAAAGEMKYTTYTVSLIQPDTIDDFVVNAVPLDGTNKELNVSFAGKGAGDNLCEVTTGSGAGNIRQDWNNIKDYNGFLIIKGNAYIKNGSFSVRLGNKNELTSEIKDTGRWFFFEIHIDKSKTADNAVAYIDGKVHKTSTYTYTDNNDINLRLRLSANSDVIFDDVRLYAQTEEPTVTALPTLSSDKLLFGKYVNGSGKTAAALGDTNITASAFTTSDLGSADVQENEDTLAAGNYVLIYDSAKRADNGYTVAE